MKEIKPQYDVAAYSSNPSNEDIDLKRLASVIWTGRYSVLFFILVSAAIGTVYAVTLKNIYKSEVVVASASQQHSTGMLSDQLGGLAALAGVNIGASNSIDKTTLALEIIKSREFISNFIKKHDILIELMASEDWDYDSNTLIIDNELYDTERKAWVRDVSFPKKTEPSLQETYTIFMRAFNVAKDAKSGIITLSFKHYSPYFARQVLDWLIFDINEEMKIKDIQESERSIDYLQKQISNTNISEVKSTLFSLIEEQTKTLMLANTRSEYMFKVVDPAIVPEERAEPKRSLIVAVAIIFGGFLGVLAVLLFPSLRKD